MLLSLLKRGGKAESLEYVTFPDRTSDMATEKESHL